MLGSLRAERRILGQESDTDYALEQQSLSKPMENPDKRRKLILSNGKLNKQAGKKAGQNFHAGRSMLVGSSSGTGDSGRPTENTSGPTLTRNLVEDCAVWKLHMLADAVSGLGNSSGTLVPKITGTEPHAPTAPMPAMSSGFGARSKRLRSDLQNLPRQGWGGRVLLRNTDAPSMTLMNMPGPLKDRLRGSSAGPKKSLTLVPSPVVHTSGTPVPELLPRQETVLQNPGALRMHLLSRPGALKKRPQGTGDSGRPTENTSGLTLTRNLAEDCLESIEWNFHILADVAIGLRSSSGTLVPKITGTEPRAPTAPMQAMSSGFGARPKRSRADLQNLPRQGWGGRVLLRNRDAPSMTLMNMPGPLKDRLRGSSAGPKKSLTLVPTPVVHTSGTLVPELQPRHETVLQNPGAPRMHLLSRPGALKEQPQGSNTGSVQSRTSIPAPVVHNFRGINFYKRIGLWAANIWDGKQFYVGAYLSEAEAARAYDRASLKFFGRDTELNFQKDDYVKDIEEMAGFDNKGYLKLLRKRAKDPSRDKVVPGVRVCPHGWFEVRIKEQVPPKNWQSLGKYSTLEDAKRCYQAKLRSQLNV